MPERDSHTLIRDRPTNDTMKILIRPEYADPRDYNNSRSILATTPSQIFT